MDSYVQLLLGTFEVIEGESCDVLHLWKELDAFDLIYELFLVNPTKISVSFTTRERPDDREIDIDTVGIILKLFGVFVNVERVLIVFLLCLKIPF